METADDNFYIAINILKVVRYIVTQSFISDQIVDSIDSACCVASGYWFWEPVNSEMGGGTRMKSVGVIS